MRSPVIDRHAGTRARIVRAKGPEAALIALADSPPWVDQLRPAERLLRHTGRPKANARILLCCLSRKRRWRGCWGVRIRGNQGESGGLDKMRNR